MPWRASDSPRKPNTWLAASFLCCAKAIRMTDGTVHRGIKIRTLLSSSTAAKAETCDTDACRCMCAGHSHADGRAAATWKPLCGLEETSLEDNPFRKPLRDGIAPGKYAGDHHRLLRSVRRRGFREGLGHQRQERRNTSP